MIKDLETAIGYHFQNILFFIQSNYTKFRQVLQEKKQA